PGGPQVQRTDPERIPVRRRRHPKAEGNGRPDPGPLPGGLRAGGRQPPDWRGRPGRRNWVVYRGDWHGRPIAGRPVRPTGRSQTSAVTDSTTWTRHKGLPTFASSG